MDGFTDNGPTKPFYPRRRPRTQQTNITKMAMKDETSQVPTGRTVVTASRINPSRTRRQPRPPATQLAQQQTRSFQPPMRTISADDATRPSHRTTNFTNTFTIASNMTTLQRRHSHCRRRPRRSTQSSSPRLHMTSPQPSASGRGTMQSYKPG